MGVDFPCPDHTTLSRRNATVEVRRQVDCAPQGPIDVIVDSTGLKVCGQGEWHGQKHVEKTRKRWRKLHVGVDDQGQIIASTVTESNEQDPFQVTDLLDQIDQEIDRFVADGIYDQEPVYAAVEEHSPGAQVIIPPRKDAVLIPMAETAPTQRDQHLLEIERIGRFAWTPSSTQRYVLDSLRLGPRRHPIEQHFFEGPHMIRQSCRHCRCTRAPQLGGATAVGRLRNQQGLA
jgi:transposase